MKVYENDQLIKDHPDHGRQVAEVQHVEREDGDHREVREDRMNSQTVGLGSEYESTTSRTRCGSHVGHLRARQLLGRPSVFGSENTSHGCVSMTKENAKWLYDRVIPGDVVDISGSDERTVDPDNGFADWNLSWDKWIASGTPGSGAPTTTTPTH